MATHTYEPILQKAEAGRPGAGVILKQLGQKPVKGMGWRQLCGREDFLCKQEDLNLSHQHPHKKMALVSDVALQVRHPLPSMTTLVQPLRSMEEG